MMRIGVWRRTPADPTRYFSSEEVAKGKEYQRPKERAKLIGGMATAAAMLAIVWTGFAPDLLDRWDLAWPLELIIVIAVVLFVVGLPGLPTSIWTEFVHEKRWGFSTQTPWGYVKDFVKDFLIFGAFLVSAIMLPVYAFIRATDLWWLYGAVAVTGVVLIFGFLFPILVLPLMNKFTPLADADLAARLHAVAERAGVPVKEFQVMDASKRTKKDNAFFTGMGATRRVVLYDNLLEMPHENIEVVVAHELGHWRRKHTFYGAIVSLFQLPAMFGLTALITNQQAVQDWAGISTLGDPASLPLFLLVFGGLQALLSRSGAWFSRALERAADVDALELTQAPAVFADTWRRMVDRNLPDVDPSWWARTKMSHPPIAERMAFGEAWAAEHQPAPTG